MFSRPDINNCRRQVINALFAKESYISELTSEPIKRCPHVDQEGECGLGKKIQEAGSVKNAVPHIKYNGQVDQEHLEYLVNERVMSGNDYNDGLPCLACRAVAHRSSVDNLKGWLELTGMAMSGEKGVEDLPAEGTCMGVNITWVE